MRIYDYMKGILGAMGVGEDVGVPEPSWRNEEYLKAIYDKLKEGGGGSAVVEVVITTGSSTASMTSTEIKAAVASGKVVILNRDNKLYYEIDLTPGGSPNSVTFYRNSLNTGDRVTIDENGNYTYGSLTDGSYSKPSGGIPETDLAQAVKNKLNKFIVTLTPTALDYSGMMDKTVAQINEAYEAGQEIWFKVLTSATSYVEVPVSFLGKDTSFDYPNFGAEIIQHSTNTMIVAQTLDTSDGIKQTYSTTAYSLTPAT